MQWGLPLKGNYIGKIPNFQSFGAVKPHPWADQVSASPCQISPCSVQRVAPAGRKTKKSTHK